MFFRKNVKFKLGKRKSGEKLWIWPGLDVERPVDEVRDDDGHARLGRAEVLDVGDEGDVLGLLEVDALLVLHRRVGDGVAKVAGAAQRYPRLLPRPRETDLRASQVVVLASEPEDTEDTLNSVPFPDRILSAHSNI